MRAVSACVAHPNIDLQGIHCHIGSQIFSPDGFAQAAEVVLGLGELRFHRGEVDLAAGRRRDDAHRGSVHREICVLGRGLDRGEGRSDRGAQRELRPSAVTQQRRRNRSFEHPGVGAHHHDLPDDLRRVVALAAP